MIGLDTNILVRYLVRDDKKQFARAESAIRRATDQGDSLFISAIVLCELVWVLESAYGFPREDVARVVETLLLTDRMEIEHRDHVWGAWRPYRDGKGDLSDHLIGRIHRAHGCERTITFDTALRGDPLFELI
ncbi:MAG: type II toxin-antitoxin system VapC family toxin [Gemmatimonadetes bacterium]|nr:type II toxin-antitoxin system VapC family toxin [Gemmatimonadota bacterium]